MDLGNQIRKRYILDDSDEDLDEEMDRRANSSIWRDFYQSVYDSRYYSIIACFVGFYCAYQITIAPYKTVRPILSEQQKSMDALVLFVIKQCTLSDTCKIFRNLFGQFSVVMK